MKDEQDRSSAPDAQAQSWERPVHEPKAAQSPGQPGPGVDPAGWRVGGGGGAGPTPVRPTPPLRFHDGLIPAIVQDGQTGQVLMLAYMNEESLRRTLTQGRTWFWSRTRRALWMKGETSGNVQKVRAVTADCDGDTLLVQVEQEGTGACHEGDFSCFHYPLLPLGPAAAQAQAQPFAAQPRPACQPEAAPGQPGGLRPESSPAAAAQAQRHHGDQPEEQPAGTRSVPTVGAPTPLHLAAPPALVGTEVLADLWQVICDRQQHPREGSYTSELLGRGMERVAKKVGEEATEVVIEAMKSENREAFVYESADLIYHWLVMLAAKGVTPAEIFAELARRR